MRKWWRGGCALLVAAALLAPGASPLAAQAEPSPEVRALRAARALEERGLLKDAELTLRAHLDVEETSWGVLFALERVLRAQGRPVAVLPYVDNFLAVAPDSHIVRDLKLRVLAEADSAAALERETEIWIRRHPGDLERYRLAAHSWEGAFGPARALDLLQRGRHAAGDPVAFAAEMGDLLLRAGRPEQAAEEWARASGSAGGAEGVLRRVRELGEAGVRARVADALIAALERPPTTLQRRVLAVQVALADARGNHALALAGGLAPDLDGSARRTFLQDLARWGDEARVWELSLWALSTLRESIGEGFEARVLDSRIAQTALAAGDTATAMGASARLAEGLPEGSAERRRLEADRIRMVVGSADATELRTRLGAFREEFPGAPELDELAAAVAAGLHQRGDAETAGAVLAGVRGPLSALERVYLLLDRGELSAARAALLEAVAGLEPSRATEAIQLALLLGRLSGAGAAAVARAAVAAHRGQAQEAALTLERAAADLPGTERAPVLAQAARLADQVAAHADAARMRTTLMLEHPDAAEAAEATLELARWHARTRAGVATAVRLLEELIIRTPSNALVPDARRELQRLRGIS